MNKPQTILIIYFVTFFLLLVSFGAIANEGETIEVLKLKLEGNKRPKTIGANFFYIVR